MFWVLCLNTSWLCRPLWASQTSCPLTRKIIFTIALHPVQVLNHRATNNFWNSACPLVVTTCTAQSYHLSRWAYLLSQWMPGLGAQALCPQPPPICYGVEHGALCKVGSPSVTICHLVTCRPPHLLWAPSDLSSVFTLDYPRVNGPLSVVWKILRDT